MARVFAAHRPDRGPQPRGRDARRSLDRRPAAVHRHQHRRHLRAARSGAGVRRGARRRRRATAFRFLHVSTDEVYGTLGADGLFSEETPYAPNSPYAASKAAADHLVRAYFHTYGLPVLITNCSNNYGPFQFPEKLIPLMILNALDGRPLPIYGDGGNVRDWLHVEDHCAGILLVLARGTPRREVQHRRRQRAHQPRDRRSHLRRARSSCARPRQPGAQGRRLSRPEDVRARSSRPRSPLRDRRDARSAASSAGRRGTTSKTVCASTARWYVEHRDWCEHVQAGVQPRAAWQSQVCKSEI